jgi:hypothetical protein
MNCLHEDFNDYFGKCSDCGADRKQVIEEQFRAELQAVYTKMLEAFGIESGDIEPLLAIELEEKENQLADIVARWLNNRYEESE